VPSDSGSQAVLDARTAVARVLKPVVGEFVAKTAISMASKRIGKTPETIELSDAQDLATALRPALRTLLGTPTAEALVARIRALGDGESAGEVTP
jgi:hypothetical protein